VLSNLASESNDNRSKENRIVAEIVVCFVLAYGLCAVVSPAHAQTFPAERVASIVPFSVRVTVLLSRRLRGSAAYVDPVNILTSCGTSGRLSLSISCVRQLDSSPSLRVASSPPGTAASLHAVPRCSDSCHSLHRRRYYTVAPAHNLSRPFGCYYARVSRPRYGAVSLIRLRRPTSW